MKKKRRVGAWNTHVNNEIMCALHILMMLLFITHVKTTPQRSIRTYSWTGNSNVSSAVLVSCIETMQLLLFATVNNWQKPLRDLYSSKWWSFHRASSALAVMSWSSFKTSFTSSFLFWLEAWPLCCLDLLAFLPCQ